MAEPMLVIPRSKNQGVVIRDDIIITVVEILEDEVLISIEHPDNVLVEQSESLSAVSRTEKEPVAV
jgi:carbon storage regulator CsrA